MRRWSLILSVLLTGIFLADISKADEKDLLLQSTKPAPAMTSDCKAASADLPMESVIFASTLEEEVCGPCGSPYCWGAQFSAVCGPGGWGYCEPLGYCADEFPNPPSRACYCM